MTLKSWSYVIGILMVAIMGLSAIMPLLSQNTLNTPRTQVEPTPQPTLPPPPDTSTITFDKTYLHPSGLFTVAEPSGWTSSQPETSGDNVRALFSNTNAQSIVQVDVTQLPASDGPVTLDDVDAYFNDTYLSSSWRNYTNVDTSNRQRVDDKLVLDFSMTANGQTYVARQKSWTDGEWVYSVRVVMPSNATNALVYVLDNVAETIQPQKEFFGTPFNWKAYFDQQDTSLIRFPSEWTLADSAPGKPASIQGLGNTTLRVETAADAVVDSEDAARAWVEASRSGANILSVKPVTRDGVEGYSVAYSYKTLDGDSTSGLAVLLNGPDEKLHVANLRFPGADVDLNAEENVAAHSDLLQVMNSFTIQPELANVTTSPTAS
jgi:hypothetical protein